MHSYFTTPTRPNDFSLDDPADYFDRRRSKRPFSSSSDFDFPKAPNSVDPSPRPHFSSNSKLTQIRNSLSGHSDEIQFAALSSSGSFVVTSSRDNTAALWHVAVNTDEPLRRFDTLKHPERVFQSFVSDNANRVVTACQDGNIRVWTRRRPPEGNECFKINHRDFRYARACQISADGSLVVATMYASNRTPLKSGGKKCTVSFRACVILRHAGRRYNLFEKFMDGKVDQCRMSSNGSVIALGLSGVPSAGTMAKDCAIVILDQSGKYRKVLSNVFPSENSCTKWDLSETGDKLAVVANSDHSIELYEDGFDRKWDKAPMSLSARDTKIYSFCRFTERGKYLLTLAGEVQGEWKLLRIFSVRKLSVLYEIPFAVHQCLPLCVESRMSVIKTQDGDCEQFRMLCKTIADSDTFEIDLVTLRYLTGFPSSMKQKSSDDGNKDSLNRRLTYHSGQSQINSPYGRQTRSTRSPPSSPAAGVARQYSRNEHRQGPIVRNNDLVTRAYASAEKHKDHRTGADDSGGRASERGSAVSSRGGATPKNANQSFDQEYFRRDAWNHSRKRDSRIPIDVPTPGVRHSTQIANRPAETLKYQSRDPRLRARGASLSTQGRVAQKGRSSGRYSRAADKIRKSDEMSGNKCKAKPTSHRIVQPSKNGDKTSGFEKRHGAIKTSNMSVPPIIAKLQSSGVYASLNSHLGSDERFRSSPTLVGKENSSKKNHVTFPLSSAHVIEEEAKSLNHIGASTTLEDREKLDTAKTAQATSVMSHSGHDQPSARPLKRMKLNSCGTASGQSSATDASNEEKKSPQKLGMDTFAPTVECNDIRTASFAESRKNHTPAAIAIAIPASNGVETENANSEQSSCWSLTQSQPSTAATSIVNVKGIETSANIKSEDVCPQRNESVLPKKASSFRCPGLFGSPPQECVGSGHVTIPTPPTCGRDKSEVSTCLRESALNEMNENVHGRELSDACYTQELEPPYPVVEKTTSECTAQAENQLPEVLVHVPLHSETQDRSKASSPSREDTPESDRPIAFLVRQSSVRWKQVVKQVQDGPEQEREAIRRPGRKASRRERSHANTGRAISGSRPISLSNGEAPRELRSCIRQVRPESAGKSTLAEDNERVPDGQEPDSKVEVNGNRGPERQPTLCSLQGSITAGKKALHLNPFVDTKGMSEIKDLNSGEMGKECDDTKAEEELVTPLERPAKIPKEEENTPCQQGKGTTSSAEGGDMGKAAKGAVRNEFCALHATNSESEEQEKMEGVSSILQRKARLAFERAADRVSTSGQQYITGARAFKTVSELLKTSPSFVQDKDVAKAMYNITGPENKCTEGGFVRAFCELYENARTLRRQGLTSVFNEALPEGDSMILVYHARDLLKKAFGAVVHSSLEHWTDGTIEDIFEAEGSGMLVDVEAFISGAEKIICALLGRDGDTTGGKASA